MPAGLLRLSVGLEDPDVLWADLEQALALSTVVFFPEGAFGPTNNCVGIGKVLLERGARVVFVVEESFAGTLEAQGFEEALMRLKPPPEVEEAPGQFWKDFVRETAPEFRKPTIEQLERFILPVWQELVDGARYVDERLEEIFAEVEPDVIVQDNVVAFPAVPASGRPWVRIVSCNPLELKEPALPPTFSGYPTTDPSRWDEFRARYRELHEPLQSEFSAFCEERGAPPLPGISSSTSRRSSTSASIRPRRTTSARSRSARPGTGSTPACAPSTRPSGRRPGTERSSTSASAASARPTST